MGELRTGDHYHIGAAGEKLFGTLEMEDEFSNISFVWFCNLGLVLGRRRRL